jgi:hypothetical protein
MHEVRNVWRTHCDWLAAPRAWGLRTIPCLRICWLVLLTCMGATRKLGPVCAQVLCYWDPSIWTLLGSLVWPSALTATQARHAA